MSDDWITRMEQRVADRDLAKRLAEGKLPYLTAEVLDTVPDVQGIAEQLRRDGETDTADKLDEIIAGVQSTLADLWEAINDAAEDDE